MEEVADWFPGEVPEGMKVESVTMWTVPISKYLKREWFTVKEVAEKLGVPKNTLWTWIKRGEFFRYQAHGLVQNAGGSTTLIHCRVLEEEKKRGK